MESSMSLSLPLLQSWLQEPEYGFRPGMAMFSWSDGRLHLQADLVGKAAGTTASAHGQKLWEHGDVVELFLQREGDEDYREYQVAPNGFTLALHYPDISCVADVRSGKRCMDEFLADEIPTVQITTTGDGWRVLLSVPLMAAAGERFRVSCCRYDAGAGSPPVISSTSPHPVRDFHRPRDWREFIPVAG